jgi:hypothetical protein
MTSSRRREERRREQKEAERVALSQLLADPLNMNSDNVTVEWHIHDEGELSTKHGTREGPVAIVDMYLTERSDGSVTISITLEPVTS